MAAWTRVFTAATLLATIALSACATVVPHNRPLSPDALQGTPLTISRGGYRIFGLRHDGALPDVIVLVAFSGGGKRSSAFGYGVLRGLREFQIPVNGQERPLLDEITMMSSVSGGSFPAAYYGLYRDKIFTDFEKDFLRQDINSYIWGSYLLPWNFFKATNDRMEGVYDKLMFHGATYADMQRNGTPLVSINATDVTFGLPFAFTQDQFDLLCSDLTQYPIARAVAASNGFPVLFSPITLKNYGSQCGGRVPGWVVQAEQQHDNDPLSRRANLTQAARRYLDSNNTRFVHLLDGGIADNLAMRTMINTFLALTGVTAPLPVDPSNVRRIILISADGEAAADPAPARQESLSGLGGILGAVSGTQIDRYNFETLIVARAELGNLRDNIKRRRCAIGAQVDGHPCGDVESEVIHLSLATVPDPAVRTRLQQIPTGLSISDPDVDALISAGENAIRNCPQLLAIRDDLRKAPPARTAGILRPDSAE